MDTSLISKMFRRFADYECRGSSELYEYLSLRIAEDNEILQLSSFARQGQPVPNLFLGAVHFLLLKGNDHDLKEYYPSIVRNPRKIEEFFTYFKDFCQTYRDEIITILRSRLVQTNEVRRCAYLYPIFCFIYNELNLPLSLIEIGTSAGLQLLWNQYSYSYGTNEIFGNLQSNVHISSEIRGDHHPFLLLNSPPVAFKVGLDLHISNLSDTEDYLWLKSLIWPEHQERLELFENAAQLFNQKPVKLIEGDGIALLTDVIEQIPKDTTICIFHTHVANQIPKDQKYQLIEQIKKVGSRRNIFHIYNNMWDKKLHLDYYVNGIEFNKTIGKTDGHGKWFYWGLD